MSRTDSPWELPDRTLARAEQADREVRMSDFALMALLPLRTIEVSGYPINEFAMAGLVGLCLFRPARGGARLPALVVIANATSILTAWGTLLATTPVTTTDSA